MEDKPLEWLAMNQTMDEKAFNAFLSEFAARLSLIFNIPYELLGVGTMPDNLYTLPEAAVKMGISQRTLYRYMNKDATQPDKLKIFPGVIKIRHKKPGKKETVNYYFTSSDIRTFNKKYGKPEDRDARILIRDGSKKKSFEKLTMEGKK